MKKITTLLILLLLITSCSDENQDFIVGQESLTLENISNVELLDLNGNNVSTNSLKILWEKQMKEEGLIVKLSFFEIIETYDEQNKKIFFLKSKSEDGTIETGAFLSKELGGNTYVLAAKQCSCKGCPNGCNLVVNGTTCSCSGCPTDTSKKCEKTETAIVGFEKP